MSDPTIASIWADDLGEGVVQIGEGRVSWLNRAACEMLGVERQRATDLPLIAVLRDHRLEQAYLEGRTVEVSTRGRILEAEAHGWGLLLRDVSEIRSSREQARELLAVLSHELRTPATTIRSTLEALRLGLPPEQRLRFLDQAEAECVRLVRLLNDLTVDVSPPRERSVDLGEVVARACAIARSTLEQHRIEVHSAVAGDFVWADPDKLLQVVLNLLENAAVHGPDDAEVLLTTESDPHDPEVLVLSVRDRGIPLDNDRIEELFAPHARASSAKAKGTGLGLYIVRSIAERWGGRAWGASDADGNVFSVAVPSRRGAG